MFEKAFKNLKKILFSIQVAFYLTIIIHLCQRTLVDGDLFPNLPLLLITVAYLIFLVIVFTRDSDNSKKVKKLTKKIYKWSKILIKGVTLFITVNAFSSLEQSSNIFSIITTFIMTVGWISTLLIEIIALIIEKQIKKIKKSLLSSDSPIGKFKNSFAEFLKKNDKKEEVNEDTSIHK